MAAIDPRHLEASDPDMRVAAQIADLRRRLSAVERAPSGAPVFTVATLPAASSVRPGTIVLVTDGGAGAQWRGSDGTSWAILG